MLKRQQIPDCLSLARIPLALALPAAVPHPVPFALVYAAAVVSDVCDGWLARRWGCASVRGARLDSLADLVFFGVILSLVPDICPDALRPGWLILACLIVVVRLVGLVATRVRFGRVVMLHILANKATGAAVVLAFPLCALVETDVLLAVVFGLGLFAAGEDCVLSLTMREPDPDRKSIFSACAPTNSRP